VPANVTLNVAMDAIINDDLTHEGRIETWSDPPAPEPNGLREYVFPDNNKTTEMMGYLTNAFNALEDLKSNPPMGMSEQDFINMQQGINDWVTNGLGEPALT